MKIAVEVAANHGHIRTAVRCPHCGKEAVFEPLGPHDYILDRNGHVGGQRKCPNPQCRGHLFVIFQHEKVIAAYPPMRLDFDPENIPAAVLKTFSEAITCHSAGCFVAAAIMVRRTLEEVCSDRQAQGNNLRDRISNLKSKIVIPQELIDAMNELRLLGNDAAHVEAKDYDDISDEEVVIAIQFTKEILKSLYQYSTLLAKMRALKKQP